MVSIIVEPPEINIIHHPNGCNRKREDLSARFEMAGDHLVRVSRCT